MSKAKIIDKNCVESVLGEKNLLSELHHPFIVNMIYSFQDDENLYLVMDLLPGGNLRYHLSIKNCFNEKQVKFLIGCIMIGLKYIHGQNILHRDIKPENLVFDKNGYLRITDFGIAKHYVVNNKKDTSGTVGYLAPEVLCNVNHNFSIDYYAVGIITYELMYGHRPYLGKTKHEVKQLILTRQAEIDYDDLPDGFSNDIADFINKLIQRKPKNRLGKDSIKEVINHPWFNEFDWDNVLKKKVKAPYVSKLGDNFDKKYCLQANKIGTDTMERYKNIMKDENYNLLFKDYNCTKIPEELKGINLNTKLNSGAILNHNNVTSNISTTTISRNNRNDNKDKISANISNKNISNPNLAQDKIKKNDNNNLINNNLGIKDNQNELIKAANNLQMDNLKNNMEKGDNKINKLELLLNQSHQFFRSKNNILKNSNLNSSSKISRQEKTNKNKNTNDLLNKDYVGVSGFTNLKDKKSMDDINNDDNIVFNDNEYDIVLQNKRKGFNPSMSMSNLNIHEKNKNLFNSSIVEGNSSMITMNSGILKNMKYQYKEIYPKKNNKYSNFTSKNSKKTSKSDISDNLLKNNKYANKIDKNIIKINNKSLPKSNQKINIPNSKIEQIRNEILRNSGLKQNEKFGKKSSQLIISSTIYPKEKKLKSTNNSMFISTKRLTSSHSMLNLKASNNNTKHKPNIVDTKRSSKNLSLVNKKLPFINIYFNKKKGGINFGDEINFLSYGKVAKGNKKSNDSTNINPDYFTDRIRNKHSKHNSKKINYNKKSDINLFQSYRKQIK